MKSILVLLATAFSFTCVSCDRKENMSLIGCEAFVSIPANRTKSDKELQRAGELEDEIKSHINAYMSQGSIKQMSYVAPILYITSEDCDTKASKTIGIVLKDGKTLLGIDITGSDASKALITGVHEVFVNDSYEEVSIIDRYVTAILAEVELERHE